MSLARPPPVSLGGSLGFILGSGSSRPRSLFALHDTISDGLQASLASTKGKLQSQMGICCPGSALASFPRGHGCKQGCECQGGGKGRIWGPAKPLGAGLSLGPPALTPWTLGCVGLLLVAAAGKGGADSSPGEEPVLLPSCQPEGGWPCALEGRVEQGRGRKGQQQPN